MKKIAFAAAVLLALFVAASSTLTARAEPTQLVAVNCAFLTGIGDGCTNGISDAEVAMLAGADGVLQPSELDALAGISAPQVSVPGAANIRLAVFAFVDADTSVIFDVPTNLTLTHTGPISGDFVCDGQEEDCDGDGIPGDGVIPVVVGASIAAITNVGATAVVQVSQEAVLRSLDVLIVGEPARIAIFESEEVVSAGNDDCTGQTVDRADDLDKLLLEAVVTDAALNQLVGMPVHWQVNDPSIALIDRLSAVTVNNGARISELAILCGQDRGEVLVTATTTVAPIDPATVTKTVVGEPADIALSADPMVVQCDGTSSSIVTAVVKDAEGNPVAPGTTVTFDVIALGTADPTVTTTNEAGIATSTATPSALAETGIVVTVISGGAAEQIRIDCAAPPLEPPAPVDECLPGGQQNAIARNIERRSGAEIGERGYHARFDVNGDGVIDGDDLATLLAIPVCEPGERGRR